MIGKYKIIALCTCRIQDGECHELVNELDQQLRNMGCRLFVYNCISKLNTNAEINAQISVFDIIDPSFCDAVVAHLKWVEFAVVYCNLLYPQTTHLRGFF